METSAAGFPLRVTTPSTGVVESFSGPLGALEPQPNAAVMPRMTAKERYSLIIILSR
jgi:hypothetical protein